MIIESETRPDLTKFEENVFNFIQQYSRPLRVAMVGAIGLLLGIVCTSQESDNQASNQVVLTIQRPDGPLDSEDSGRYPVSPKDELDTYTYTQDDKVVNMLTTGFVGALGIGLYFFSRNKIRH